MPQIPIYTARQSLPGEAAAVRGDVGSAGAAGAVLARTADRAGAAIDDFAEREAQAQRTIDLLDRSTKAKQELTNFQLSLDSDQDYATKRQRFVDKANEVRERYAEGLNSLDRARFDAHFDEVADTKVADVTYQARRQMVDDGITKYRASVDGSINTALAAGSTNEREAAFKSIDLATAEAHAAGFLTARQAGDYVRGAREKIDTVLADRLITDNPAAAVAALDPKSGQFTNMDPLRREQYRQHAKRTVEAEARAARAEIRGDARDALTVMARGDDYAGFDALRQKAGMADPETATALDEAKGRLDHLRDFTLLAPAKQMAAIDAFSAKEGGLTGSESIELHSMREIAAATARGLATDPLLFAAQRKVIANLPMLDPGRPETWTTREQAARYVQAYYGLARAPLLTDQEAKALPENFVRLGHVDQSRMLDDMRGALSKGGYQQVVDVLGKKMPALAVAAQPEFAGTAPQILEGAEIRRKTPEVMPAGIDTQPVFNSYFGTDDGFAFALNPALRQVYVDAAKDKYAYDKARSGAIDKGFDQTAMEQALRDVTGGGMVEWNGRKLLRPRADIDQSALDRGMASLTDDALTMTDREGRPRVAVTPTGQRVTANDVRRWGQFHSLDVRGIYALTLRNTPVLATAGVQPIELKGATSLPGALHLNPALAPHVPMGAARPFAPGEFITNPNGSWSSELTTTIGEGERPDFNGGKATVLPTLWLVDGKPTRVSEDQAVDLAKQSGLRFRAFESTDAAEKYSIAREAGWQNVEPHAASSVAPLWEGSAAGDAARGTLPFFIDLRQLVTNAPPRNTIPPAKSLLYPPAPR